jgi:hypothetical protein
MTVNPRMYAQAKVPGPLRGCLRVSGGGSLGYPPPGVILLQVTLPGATKLGRQIVVRGVQSN